MSRTSISATLAQKEREAVLQAITTIKEKLSSRAKLNIHLSLRTERSEVFAQRSAGKQSQGFWDCFASPVGDATRTLAMT